MTWAQCHAVPAYGLTRREAHRQVGYPVAAEHKPVQVRDGICVTHLSRLVPCGHSSTQSAAKSLPSRFREMRMTLLLLSKRVLSRGNLGKPSSLTMTLSDKSRLSN